MFKVFTGNYRALETALVDDVCRRKRVEPLAPALVVSPSGHMIARLQRLLAKKMPSILNLHAISFYGLAERILSDVPSAERLVADPALYTEVIRGLLDGDGDVELILRHYFRPDGKPLAKGLPSALAGTLRDLRDSGARVKDSLEAALEGHLGEAAPEAAPTLELYARMYEVLHQHGLRTNADQLRRAAARLSDHPFVRLQQAVYLYGFYDLTGVQLDFALAFAQHPDASVFFLYEDGRPAFAYAERLLNDPAFASKTRERIAVSSAPSTPTVEIWNCSGLRDEVWLAAKKIVALADQGVPYSEMAVTARTLGPYIGTLREVFAHHHIPYSTEQEEPVGAYPLIKWVRQLFLLEPQDYPVGQVFDVLKSPYCRLEAARASAIPMWLCERLARHAGIVGGWQSWEERLRYWARAGGGSADSLAAIASALSPGEAREAAVALRAWMSGLREILGAASDSPAMPTIPWSEHARWAKTVLERWCRLPDDATEDERRLHESVLQTLDGIATLDALGRPVERSRFLEVWEDKLERLTVVLAPSNTRGVQVLDVMSARGLSFQAVLLLGMNEKFFPRLIREDPFLSDAARAALAGALGCRLGRKLDGYQEERLLFELTVQMAERSLVLSYQRSDEEGKVLIPSLYLHELAAPSLERRHLARTPAEKWTTLDPILLTPKELSVWINREAKDGASFCRLAGFDGVLYSALVEAQDELDSFRRPLGHRDGSIGAQPALERLMQRGYSPDALKDLAECPFRYFAAKVLAIEPADEIARHGDLESAAAGQLIHRILEVFFRSLRDQPGSCVTLQALHHELNGACDRTFDSFRETAAGLYPIAWQAAQATIRKRLHTFLEADLKEIAVSGFKPTFLEQEVSGTLEPLGGPFKDVRFHGRIDRIDLRELEGETQYRIVDYKTGRPTSASTKTETAILRGQYLQLPVYLGVTEGWLKEKLGHPVRGYEAAFYNLADWEKGETSPSITPVFWERHGRPFGENLAGLMTLVREGLFYIRPSENLGYCALCAYAQVCRKEHKPTVARSERHPARKANDERLSRKADRD